MTRELLNTLFVSTEGARLFLDNDRAVVKIEEKTALTVPLHHLGSICLFGIVHPSVPLLLRCADEGRSVSFFDMFGKFKARIEGRKGGNVLLRRDQWAAASNLEATLQIAKAVVSGKLQNSRQVLLRAARDYPKDAEIFKVGIRAHENGLEVLRQAQTLDEVRGTEGDVAAAYFAAFPYLIRTSTKEFSFASRSRRPPRDRMNALLSFVYSIATSDCVSACEGVGLDPQCGFLHAIRPGRPSLALDLVEEFRSVWLDRFCVTLINRREIIAKDFQESEGGSWRLTDVARKKLLAAYQLKKQQEVRHRLLAAKVPIGLLPHLQARLLARHLRGDIPMYIPYTPI